MTRRQVERHRGRAARVRAGFAADIQKRTIGLRRAAAALARRRLRRASWRCSQAYADGVNALARRDCRCRRVRGARAHDGAAVGRRSTRSRSARRSPRACRSTSTPSSTQSCSRPTSTAGRRAAASTAQALLLAGRAAARRPWIRRRRSRTRPTARPTSPSVTRRARSRPRPRRRRARGACARSSRRIRCSRWRCDRRERFVGSNEWGVAGERRAAAASRSSRTIRTSRWTRPPPSTSGTSS